MSSKPFPAAGSPTVFVVDDDPAVCKALARLLRSAGHAVETFSSAREFLDRVPHDDVAGCLVLDVQMPGLSGIELQKELKELTPPIPIIFLTGHGDISMGVGAMKEGAVDFLTKPVQDESLLRAVQQAIDRNSVDRARYAEWRVLQERWNTLTPREREVMALVVSGRLNKQAASELGTVEKTIKVHRGRVMEKMQVTSLVDLVVVAEKLGIGPRQMTPPVSKAIEGTMNLELKTPIARHPLPSTGRGPG